MAKPRFQYDTMIGKLPAPVTIAPPRRATFLIEEKNGPANHVRIKKGDTVKTGQRIALTDDSDAYAVSSITGKISAIEGFPGEAGRKYIAVSVDASNEEEIDTAFEALCENPTRETADRYFAGLPGEFSLQSLDDGERPIHTLVINAVDRDLFVVTSRYAIASLIQDLKRGIGILKAITGIQNVVLAAPRDTLQGYGHIGAEAIAVDTTYPYGLPYFVAQKILGQEMPVNKPFPEVGLCFLNVEAVAALGRSVEQKKIVDTKLMTFIDKQGRRSLVTAKIGTPIGDVFKAFGQTVNDEDRIIIGGPLTGYTVFSESYPVQPGTDAIMIQDKDDVTLVSDSPCINCGDCIRVCPSRIQVNLLIRFLEAGQYEDAADSYDLHACLECGLCSFVCVARIPIFQYIKLAKYELGRVNAEETTNG